MRLLRLLALGCIIAFHGASFAQTIQGVVRDARSSLPLENANIVLDPGNRGAASGRSGEFAIDGVLEGNYTLRVSHIGYKTYERAVEIGAGVLAVRVELEAVAMPGPEIEISAFRAKERYSPVTFADITQSDLRERYIVQDIPVLLSYLPSAMFYSESGNGIGYNYIRIRGFDQRRLSIMVNGIPQNDPEDHNAYWLNFADLLGSTENIQVQRGAGSAFYGPPAIGGSINLVTGDFADRKGVTVSMGYGGYTDSDIRNATRRYAISGSSGLIDNKYVIFGRLSQLHSDGYRDHSFVDKSTYYFSATRYDESFTTRFITYGGPVQDGLVYTGLPKFAIKDRIERRKNFNYWEADDTAYTYTQNRRLQEREEFSQPHYELHNEWRINDKISLSSALFFVRGYGYFDYDGTGYTDTSYYRMTSAFGFSNAPNPANPLIHAWVDNRQFGWLPRVTLNHDYGATTAGLELRQHNSLHYGTLRWAENLPEGYDPDRRYYEYTGEKDIVSAYIHHVLPLSAQLNLLADLQYVFNKYRLYKERFVGTDFTQDYHFLNWRLGANYNLTEAFNLYANIGYTQHEPRLKNLYDAAESSGGATPQFEARPDGTYDFTKPFVKPESLINAELGVGYASDRLQLYVNGYFMDFTDEIVKNGQLDRFGQPMTGNAEQTRHFGVEVAGRISPLPNLTIDANATISGSRLEKYVEYQEIEGQIQPVALDGNRIAGFPEQLANLTATWRMGGFLASVSMKYVGDQYTDNYQDEKNKVDPYTVFDLAAGYRLPGIMGLQAVEVRASIYNLFDNLYAQSGEGNQFFVAAERNYMIDLSLHL